MFLAMSNHPFVSIFVWELLGVIAIFCVAVAGSLHDERQLKVEEEERERNATAEHEERIRKEVNDFELWYLKDRTREEFGIELSTVHEAAAQDEIVRMVNLLAFQVATACVNSDKYARGEKVEAYRDPDEEDYDKKDSGKPWSLVVSKLKILWSQKRNWAIKIVPELTNRLPHFSEFEPLKSYREEHIAQKRRKVLK